MLMARVLAEAVVESAKNITWLPAYGAEVRGGAAHCMLIISDDEIASPYIDCADSLIVMNGPSLRKYLPRLKNKDGLLILNSSLAKAKIKNKNLKVIKVPCNEIAERLGNIKVANMVALGAYVARKKITAIKDILQVIETMGTSAKKEELIAINKKALNKGVSYGKG